MLNQAMGSFSGVSNYPEATSVRTATASISAAQLDSLLHQIERATQKARELVSGRSHAELTTSLESTSWSVAQCLDHLAQTTNAFLAPIAEAIADASQLKTNRKLKTGALTQVFIRSLEPPYQLHFKVLAQLVPQRHDFQSAWSAFEESQHQLAGIILSADGLAVDQVRVESPVYARFSYNVYGALRMLAAHQRRHLWQIEQILKMLDAAATR